MIFSPEMVEKVMDGSKVVTRRRLPTRYQAGKMYAVQPGRGKRHVGHIEVLGVNTESLWSITEEDARLEGFANRSDFKRYWKLLHGTWKPLTEVARIAFRLAPSCADCGGSK